MKNRRKNGQSKVWTWISFIVFGAIIALLATSLLKKKSPATVLSEWWHGTYDAADYSTYKKDQLVKLVTQQESKIDSIERELEKYQHQYGVGRARVNVTTESLNMRQAPRITGELIAKIPNQTFVGVIEFAEREETIDGATGKWCKIKYGNQEGWVWGNYLEVLE